MTETLTTNDDRLSRIHELFMGPVAELAGLLHEELQSRNNIPFLKQTPLEGSETGASEEQYQRAVRDEIARALEDLQSAHARYYGAGEAALVRCGVQTSPE